MAEKNAGGLNDAGGIFPILAGPVDTPVGKQGGLGGDDVQLKGFKVPDVKDPLGLVKAGH